MELAFNEIPKEVNWTEMKWNGIVLDITHDSKHSLPGSHSGEYSRFYTLQRSTPTSTVSTNSNSTRTLAEQCSFTH
jgi:hypothetical protein